MGGFVRQAAYAYRLRQDGALMPCYRALVYTLLGYALSGQASLGLMTANTLLMGLLLMFLGAYDNYWDWHLLDERNGMRAMTERWPAWLAFGAVLAPWLLILPALHVSRAWGLSRAAEAGMWALAAWAILYATPGVRLKTRPLSFFMAPLWACVLCWQAYAAAGPAPAPGYVFGVLGAVFLLQCHAEVLHRVEDHWRASGRVPQRLLACFRWLPGVSVVVALGAAWFNLLFLNTALWSFVRLRAVRGIAVDRVPQLRRQVWHPAWSLPEFAVYALIAIAHRVMT